MKNGEKAEKRDEVEVTFRKIFPPVHFPTGLQTIFLYSAKRKIVYILKKMMCYHVQMNNKKWNSKALGFLVARKRQTPKKIVLQKHLLVGVDVWAG